MWLGDMHVKPGCPELSELCMIRTVTYPRNPAVSLEDRQKMVVC